MDMHQQELIDWI